MKAALFILLVYLFGAVDPKESIDLLVYNATIYTVDNSFSTTEAMAVKNGKIVATGTTQELEGKYIPRQRLDAGGKFLYPGFIDAHAHFLGYGYTFQRVDLVGTITWEEVLDKTKAFAPSIPGTWIEGRGWDQNDWPVKEFPSNERLNELFPNRPVILTRIDGHAAIANRKALEMAGIKAGDQLTGGEVEVKDGKLTGILVDRAIGLVTSRIPRPSKAQFTKAIVDAQKNCFAVGLTTIDDCGASAETVEAIKALYKAGTLKMRLYVMLSDDWKNYSYLEKTGIIKTDRLNVRSFKVYVDGALGSRGACLLEPYSDKPGHTGFLLNAKDHYDSIANRIAKHGFQMCTHAIGDSGNRTMLNIYAKYLGKKNDLRWRIEHAQVVDRNDFDLFGKYSIIPSVQPTHATSDMYWAGDRLGKEREKGAYAYKELLSQNGWLPLGTDFPVEDISPFKTFFAAVVRKDSKGWPADGYQPENALTREEAIRGMTIWAAKSNFEEKEKGSLEKGKWADFILLDQDLMTTHENMILQTNVLKTYIAGEKVYQK
ncbi:MAG: amidohydrolase [Chitinophagaceae bacterium]|nr:amidohydrolase [Chitinophagaceae bacterium]